MLLFYQYPTSFKLYYVSANNVGKKLWCLNSNNKLVVIENFGSSASLILINNEELQFEYFTATKVGQSGIGIGKLLDGIVVTVVEINDNYFIFPVVSFIKFVHKELQS